MQSVAGVDQMQHGELSVSVLPTIFGAARHYPAAETRPEALRLIRSHTAGLIDSLATGAVTLWHLL